MRRISGFGTLAISGLLVSSLIYVSTISPLQTHAQTIGTTDPLTLDVSPEYPVPYQTVTITPSSTLFDIGDSTVTVTVNGQAFFSGTGGAGINVPVGGPGTATTVVVSVVSGGQTYTQQLTIRPAQVALVTEPISTTHEFYEGEGLVSPEGEVRLIAIPDFRTSSGKEIDPASLEYTWSLGDQILQSDSGIGQSVLDATASERYRDSTVSVLVQTQDGSIVAQAQTTVSPVDPITRIYVDDPLLGPLYNNALSGTVTMPDVEDTYLGVPYYFSEAPALEWDVNGTNSGSSGDLTVRATGNGPGTAELSFTATQSDTTQTANSTLAVNFGQSSGGGFFGL